jgi:hypothetical protein
MEERVEKISFELGGTVSSTQTYSLLWEELQ